MFFIEKRSVSFGELTAENGGSRVYAEVLLFTAEKGEKEFTQRLHLQTAN
jgi:hypothetical protein